MYLPAKTTSVHTKTDTQMGVAAVISNSQKLQLTQCPTTGKTRGESECWMEYHSAINRITVLVKEIRVIDLIARR